MAWTQSINRRSLLVGLAGATVAIPALAQTALQSPDEFRLMELMGGDFAIQTSRIALQRSRDPRVRDFAQLEINEQMSVAAALGAMSGGVPLRPDQQAIIAKLSAMPPGRAFDHAYVQGQIAGHRELFELNRAYSQAGLDPIGRSVATVAVPTIQTHLTILRTLG